MKFFYLSLCCLLGSTFTFNAYSQENTTNIAATLRPAAIGFGFNMYDFASAQRIRQTSLGSALNNKQVAKFSEMAPGVSVVYAKGLRPKIDFNASIGFGSGKVYLENNPSRVRNTGFVAADASIHLKLLTEEFPVNPFISAGVGATVTEGFYGAILPLGLGIRFRLTDEASIGLQSQYRVAVTETAGYHFIHGITIMGKL